ncbi:MAG: cyclic pyranopterin monophosphate synthase MoaC [Candidatus Sericytochromatia bacterium]
MADITDKPVTHRVASARGEVRMRPETLDAILDGQTPKGDVLTIAQLAGIQGAKRCPDLIPLCHPLLLSGVEVHLYPDRAHSRVVIQATVKNQGQTGVEMEALCAVSAAALTLYDMCKGIDREMVIADIGVLRKSGGQSGDFVHTGLEVPHG